MKWKIWSKVEKRLRINNIKPEEKTNILRNEIERIFSGVFKTQIFWKGKTLNITFRLPELKPQDTNYRLSKYWTVEETDGFYPDSEQKRLVAVNFAVGCRMPIKRGYALQESDWILVNQTLNRICDQLGISATIRSSLIKIRDGKKNVWLSNYIELLKDIVEVKGEDYTYSDALQKAIEEASVEEKYKFEAVFIAEPFEVNEDTRIRQKIFTDYDELDALAKAFGYDSPTPEQNTNNSLSGWIATMGDSMHNPIRMLRDAMQKLRNVKYKEICDKAGKIIKTESTHVDAVMGFCQTGNFSIGYTIYTKDKKCKTFRFRNRNNQGNKRRT